MHAIVRGFTHLFEFSGRDRRSQFWPYAGTVLVVGFLAMGAGMASAMQPIFEEAERLALEHPESVTIHRTPGSYSVEYAPGSGLMPDVSGFFLALIVAVAAIVTLLAAAVTRRLHDRGLPGYVALVPVVLLGLGLFGLSQLMASIDAEPDLALFGMVMLNNMLYLASLAGLVVLLSQPGKREPNRYGPPVSD